MSARSITHRIPCDQEAPCACGSRKVAIYRESLSKLMDNMGCELGLELLAGPFCPRCQREAIEAAEARAAAGSPRPA